MNLSHSYTYVWPITNNDTSNYEKEFSPQRSNSTFKCDAIRIMNHVSELFSREFLVYSVLMHIDSKTFFKNYFENSSKVISSLVLLDDKISSLAETMLQVIKQGNSIFWCGNGGSASDAEHLAAELAGRFRVDRRPLSSYSLTSNTSTITAISNDYGFENVFARQVKGYVKKNDLLIGISTSGSSKNIHLALNQAKLQDAKTAALVGRNANLLQSVDHLICVDSLETSHIQEAHIALGQALCGYVENQIVTNL